MRTFMSLTLHFQSALDRKRLDMVSVVLYVDFNMTIKHEDYEFLWTRLLRDIAWN